MKRASASGVVADVPASDVHELFGRYRREIRGYCYRMTGSLHDAEDLAQETFTRAIAAFPRFDGHAPRAWLYRIATNACLDVLRARARRRLPPDVASAADPDGEFSQPRSESTWIEPVPDSWVDLARSETIALAYITLIQRLTPRARAVLVLRDVLDLTSAETSRLLGITVPAANNLLYRARAQIRGASPPHDALLNDDAESVLVRFVRAWQAGDVAAIAELLHEDIDVVMPPLVEWFSGRSDVLRAMSTKLFRGVRGSGAVAVNRSDWELVPTRANGAPAFGVYRRDNDGGPARWWNLMVLRFAGSTVREIALFGDPRLREAFELPETL